MVDHGLVKRYFLQLYNRALTRAMDEQEAAVQEKEQVQEQPGEALRRSTFGEAMSGGFGSGGKKKGGKKFGSGGKKFGSGGKNFGSGGKKFGSGGTKFGSGLKGKVGAEQFRVLEHGTGVEPYGGGHKHKHHHHKHSHR